MKTAKLSEVDSDKVFDLIEPHHFTDKEINDTVNYFKEKDRKEKQLNVHKKPKKQKAVQAH